MEYRASKKLISLLTFVCLLLYAAKSSAGFHLHIGADGHLLQHNHAQNHESYSKTLAPHLGLGDATSETFFSSNLISDFIGFNSLRTLHSRLNQRLIHQSALLNLSGWKSSWSGFVFNGLLQLNARSFSIAEMLRPIMQAPVARGGGVLFHIATIVLRM